MNIHWRRVVACVVVVIGITGIAHSPANGSLRDLLSTFATIMGLLWLKDAP